MQNSIKVPTVVEYIGNILARVYEFLNTDNRVIRPGSVRSYEYALLDIVMRLMFEENIDYIRFRTIVTRVGIENLLPSVETQNPEEKKQVLLEAFEYAFQEYSKELENDFKDLFSSGSESYESLNKISQSSKVTESSKNIDFKQSQNNEQNVSRTEGTAQTYSLASDKITSERTRSKSLQRSGEIIDVEVSEAESDDSSSFQNTLTTLYETLYGGVGTVNFLNLAQLINMFVCPYSNIMKKVSVLKKLEKYLRSCGLIPSTFQKVKKEETKVFEELRKIVRGQSGETSQMKVMKFIGSDRYPTYIVSVREYKFGDSISNIELSKTAMNISRKILTNRVFTTRDIVVKEYASVKSIDLVLCLDVSGSMRELSWGIPKIEIAKDAVSKYIQFLSSTSDKLALILFNFRADILWSLHLVKRFWKYMLYLLRYVYAGGGTNLAHALERSREVLQKSRSSSKHVVCVTDGRTVNANLCIKETIKLRRQGATISTIAVGENSDDDLLMKISKIGGGLFIKISNIHELGKALIIDKLHLM